jgi:hypothetical protein
MRSAGWKRFVTVAAVGALAAGACTLPMTNLSPEVQAQDELVHLNEIQAIGSHNSYHLEASEAESTLRRSVIGAGEDALQYTHAPLFQQLAIQGVRQIELDVFRDDAGGKYANPLLRQITGGGPYDPAMQDPGTKVLHIQDVDYRSNCLSLEACLSAVVDFSLAHPNHVPIAILIELKDTPLVIGEIEFVLPDPWNATALDGLDAEIRSIVPPELLLTPDDVRGDFDTLEQAVTTDGWPTLADSRGKLLFLMDNGGGYRTDYLQGHPSLSGRVMFTNANPGQADAAFVKRNDAVSQHDEIVALVGQGYVVRTRADADTVQARTGDTTTRDAALSSGAQWVSTDYPITGPSYAQRWGTQYVARIAEGEWLRCNPVAVVAGCEQDLLE